MKRREVLSLLRREMLVPLGNIDLADLDRGSEVPAALFDDRAAAVKWMLERVIAEAHDAGVNVGLCGQAPSDHPAFAEFLVKCGIDSMSVNPDSFVAVKRHIAVAEGRE